MKEVEEVPRKDPEDDDDYKGPEDVPSPPSSADFSEVEEELDGGGETSEGSGDEGDEDIFNGEFTMDTRKTVVLEEGQNKGLHPKVQGVLDTMVATLPTHLSQPSSCAHTHCSARVLIFLLHALY